MDPRFRDNYYAARLASDTYKSVETTFTTTGLGTVWTPASGKKFRLKGGFLLATVTTVLSSATPGAQIVLCDNAATSCLVPIGAISLAANVAGTPLNVWAPVTPGTTVAHAAYQPVSFNLGNGYLSAAADNVLKVGTNDGSSIGSGVITVVGMVWGTEE